MLVVQFTSHLAPGGLRLDEPQINHINCSLCYDLFRKGANDVATMESWDESEDSSDDFDPYNPQPPRVKSSFVYLSHKKPLFIPNDIHPLSMRERILIARARGDYQPLTPPVEGQFDDA